MLRGEAVKRQDDDCDECHLTVHDRLMQTPLYQDAGDDLHQVVDAHLGEHKMMLAARGSNAGNSEALRIGHDFMQSNQMATGREERFPAPVVPSP